MSPESKTSKLYHLFQYFTENFFFIILTWSFSNPNVSIFLAPRDEFLYTWITDDVISDTGKIDEKNFMETLYNEALRCFPEEQ